jgi:hypothetical protein
VSSTGATAPTTTPSPSDDPAAHQGFPAMVTATRVHHNYVALPVPSADLTDLIRIRHNVLAALADHGAFSDEVYPAISLNDGASWTIEGPQFARTAACGPCTTNRLLVSRQRTLVAWGHGGRNIHTTTDHGRHWYVASFPDSVLSVQTHGRRLLARALGNETPAGRFFTSQYVSTDKGRTWHRGRALGTVKG